MKITLTSRWSNDVRAEVEIGDSWASRPVRDPRGEAIRQALKSGSDLSGSDLSDSDLSDSDLSGSDLSDSDLSGSNLRGSNLRGSNLRGSDLSGSDLSGSDLRDIRNDLWDVLLRASGEAPALLTALQDGKVNGRVYTGPCACLIGIIANARGVPADSNLGNGLVAQSSRPIERWFLAIAPGDTPDKSSVAKITVGWVEEFIRLTSPPAAA